MVEVGVDEGEGAAEAGERADGVGAVGGAGEGADWGKRREVSWTWNGLLVIQL